MQKRSKRLCLALAVLLSVSMVLVALVPAVEAASYKKGSSGAVVTQIQTKLKSWGYYTGTVDGIYGSGTERAVRAFQQFYGLSVDGVVGRATWTELYDQFRSIQSDNGRPNAYPGTALRQGSSGQNVRLAQDRPHGVSQPEHPDRGRKIRRRHGSGSAEIPELLRPDQ